MQPRGRVPGLLRAVGGAPGQAALQVPPGHVRPQTEQEVPACVSWLECSASKNGTSSRASITVVNGSFAGSEIGKIARLVRDLLDSRRVVLGVESFLGGKWKPVLPWVQVA